MNEVKKCSLSGVAFTMDTDAFEALDAYLESLKKTYLKNPDGAEIVADIEARIAELILSAQDNSRVVEKPLILNIICQMGTAEDISEKCVESGSGGDPRIPRRLYRDTENAKLGGVCAGIGRYFDVDPVWIRLGIFMPVILTCFKWIPFMHWTGPMMGNLFGIFVICYLIMWFAVPVARTARQRLEMNGEKITAQSIGDTTAASAGCDADARAKPIVAEAVSVFGQVVLILMKIFSGLLVFGLIMLACALIIGLFAILVGGHELLSPALLHQMSIWVPVSGIFVALIPVILLIYVFMCLIASRKPGGRTVLGIFIVWLISIFLCVGLAIRGDVGDKLKQKRAVIERAFESEVVIDGQSMSLKEMLEKFDDESIVEEGRKTLHINVPSQSIDITVDKKQGELEVKAGGKSVLIRAGADKDAASAADGGSDGTNVDGGEQKRP